LKVGDEEDADGADGSVEAAAEDPPAELEEPHPASSRTAPAQVTTTAVRRGRMPGTVSGPPVRRGQEVWTSVPTSMLPSGSSTRPCASWSRGIDVVPVTFASPS